MSELLRPVRSLYYWFRVIAGALYYLVRHRTPPFAYQGMVGLFCLSGGTSNDFMSRVIGWWKRPYRFARPAGILGDLGRPERRQDLLGRLRADGYCVLPACLPPELCDSLLHFALTTPTRTRIMDTGDGGSKAEVVYERSAPRAVRYDFATAALLANPDVQRLLADESLAALAQEYLGSRPVIDVLSMWWHTAYSDAPDSHAAQFFHFDMDRPKWLKCFIYLTDVTADSGPHNFVAGSHRTGAIPRSFLERGYVRLMDEEVASEFGKDRIVEFAAPRGTIILEDTRGLHKGAPVRSGDRLMLQIQFSNSLFGGVYPDAKLHGPMRAELRQQIERFPAMYAAYVD
jgi:hypothetical protein